MIAADLTYDDALHKSFTADGREVPHVTRVLSAVGVSTDFDALSRLASVDIETSRALGRAVHADCHAFDDEDLELQRVDARVLPFVLAWETCRQMLGLTPIARQRERRVFEPRLWYTGILDGIFRRADSSRVLIDTKTGDPEDAAAHLQTAAYESAWLCEHPDEPIDERWAVWLRPEKRIPYTIVNYTERVDGYEDYGKFMACLVTFNEQPARRKRVR